MPPLFFAGEDLLRAGTFCLTYFTSFALVRPGWGFCLFAFAGFCLCCFCLWFFLCCVCALALLDY